jgi:hypothetical protein
MAPAVRTPIPCSAMRMFSPVRPLLVPGAPLPAVTAAPSLPLMPPCCRAYSCASPRQLPSSLAYCKMPSVYAGLQMGWMYTGENVNKTAGAKREQGVVRYQI